MRKGTWLEYTRETEKQCSHQTTASSLHVQHLWTDLTTTEEQLFTENSRSPSYWRTNTKHWQKNKGTESLQEAFGKEKHGSGYFLNKRKVQRGSSRSKHKASKALAHQCLRGIQASNLKRRQPFHHQRKYNAQQTIGSEKDGIGREYMWYPEQNSTYQLLKTMDQTSTSFYQHDTQTYTPNTTSGELKTTGRLNHNLQGKNTGQEYSEDLPTEDDTPQMATRAKAMTMPTQPTPQEIQEHNITHMPYRSWCPICVQAKGRQPNHPKQTSRQPIVQVDFTYITGFGDKFPTPVLTAMDVQTGMAMAAMITNKHNQFSYAQTCLQALLLECGRTEGILQSDNEEYLIALLKATAKACGNMAVRFSPAYSSQSNRNVERYHRTLTGQIRTLREQVQQNYNLQIPTDHPLMAWAVRHSAYLINRFLIRADGYQARWGRTHNAALCEFGETVMYMVPTPRQRPKLEPRFFRGTWLGKCTSTGESFVGVASRVVRARTVRRLAGEARYDKQMLGTVKGTPWNPSPPPGFQPAFLLPTLPAAEASTEQAQQADTADRHGQAASSQDRTPVPAARSTQQRDDTTPAPTGETQAKKARTEETKRHITEGEPTPTAHTTMRLGTSPTPVNRPPTTSRSLDDQIHEGSASKSRKETTQQQAATRPEEAGEQAKKPRMRINAVTVQLKSGKKSQQQQVRMRKRYEQNKDSWSHTYTTMKASIQRNSGKVCIRKWNQWEHRRCTKRLTLQSSHHNSDKNWTSTTSSSPDGSTDPKGMRYEQGL